MPKRTNAFQHLIARIERSLNLNGINVTESKEFIDSSINEIREVDVVIESIQENHPFVISVECTGVSENSRPATVEWVEQMWGKHSTLPTNKLILVSKTGFTKTAKKKAAFWNIETLSVIDAEQLDWASKIREATNVQMISFLIPYPTAITVIFNQTEGDELNLENINLQESILHDQNGSLNKTIYQAVDGWLKDPSVIEAISEKAFTDADTLIEFTRELKPGIHIFDINGQSKSIAAIKVKAKSRKHVNEIKLTHNSYGNAAIAHGTGFTFGRDSAIVFTQLPGEDPILGLEIRNNKTSLHKK